MGARIRAHDWTHTLGSPDQWPVTLRAALGICLTSAFPTAIYWGPELRLFYNDAWAPIPGNKHPQALGQPARQVWADIWEIIEPQLREVISTGKGLSATEQMLPMERHGRIEETYWNYSFTPIRDESGVVLGVFNQGNDVTAQVIARREREAEVDRLREFFQQAPGAIALLRGCDHVFELANPAYMRLIGNRDPLGQRVESVLPEIVDQGFLALLDRVYATGDPFVGRSMSVSLTNAAGVREDRLLDFVFQPVTRSGVVTGVFVQATDVTERTRAEEALLAAHVRQQFIFKLAERQRSLNKPDAIMQMTAESLGLYLRVHRVGFFRVNSADTLDFGPSWTDGTLEALHGQMPSSELGTQVNAIVRTGRTLVLNDARTDPRAADSVFLQINTIAGIGVPVMRNGQWRAGLYVNHAQERSWSDEEVALVEEVGQLAWDAVERAEAAEALRSSEERLQLALSASNAIGTWDWDIQSDRVRADAGFARLYGIDPETAAAGAPLADFMSRVHPDDLPILNSALDVALRTGKRFQLEYRVRPLNGSERWIVAQGRCAFDAEGKPQRFPGVSVDITELKRAQAAQQNLAANLAEERSRLRTLIDNLPIGVSFLDASGQVLLSNPAYRRFVPDGVPPSLVKEVAERWVAHDDRGHRLAPNRYPAARALRGDAVPAVEFLYTAPDGSERWTQVGAFPLANEDGQITGVLTFILDIDEQKRAQETLQRLNAMLESEVQQRTRERDRIWDVSDDLLGVADARGVWLNVNPAWTRSLGWEAEELLNKTSQWLECPDDVAATHTQLIALHDGESCSFETRLRSRAGEPRILSWRGVRIDGLVYTVARDVTEKRLRDAALEHMQDQLRQSQKMEAVGQLTGGIAHDFNNLLTGILGSLDMMQTRLAQQRLDSVDKYAKAAISSANRAAALTHRLLAFSRRQPLDPRPVAANALLTGMEDMLRRTMGEKIELNINTAGALWLTRCDPNQLENAVLNLAINARDAMPNGGRITIETSNQTISEHDASTHPGLKAGQYICIALTDTGVGMSREVLLRAYEPFFTTKPIGQGTGLGLSMIYGFAKQSEGYTSIDSQEGRGTTVRVYLPRYLGEIVPSEEHANASGRYRAPQLRTVLVVEDETVVRNLVTEVLTDLGYRALEAVNGRAGLDILESDESIDLVVSDVGLPELNGREMITRARERRPSLKVLYITGYAENANFGGTRAEHDIQLITKPFSLEVVAQRIREMIGD